MVKVSECEGEVVTIEEMEVESGQVEVYLVKLNSVVIVLFKDAVPEYKGTLTLKNSKVKVLIFLTYLG